MILYDVLLFAKFLNSVIMIWAVKPHFIDEKVENADEEGADEKKKRKQGGKR